MKRVTLCADDYGIHPSVSDAIIDLIRKDRIQATSCLVTSKHWAQSAQQILEVRQHADIGLHLNFTEGKGLSQAFSEGLPGLGKMLLKSHLQLLDHNDLVEEIKSQFQAFIAATGFQPDFLDGHQHVHHLPQVRDALWQVLADYSLPEKFWIRSVHPMQITTSGFKSRVIVKSGAKAFGQQLKARSLHHNKQFAGVYSLAPQQPFDKYIQHWLRELADSSLIMCHPARKSFAPDQSAADIDHTEARNQEYNYLLSENFLSDCTNNKINLVRMSECT